MKATLIFNLPEDKEEYEDASGGKCAKIALWRVANDIFRSIRRYEAMQEGGGGTDRLNILLEKEGVLEAIAILETEFYEILDDLDIKL